MIINNFQLFKNFNTSTNFVINDFFIDVIFTTKNSFVNKKIRYFKRFVYLKIKFLFFYSRLFYQKYNKNNLIFQIDDVINRITI